MFFFFFAARFVIITTALARGVFGGPENATQPTTINKKRKEVRPSDKEPRPKPRTSEHTKKKLKSLTKNPGRASSKGSQLNGPSLACKKLPTAARSYLMASSLSEDDVVATWSPKISLQGHEQRGSQLTCVLPFLLFMLDSQLLVGIQQRLQQQQ